MSKDRRGNRAGWCTIFVLIAAGGLCAAFCLACERAPDGDAPDDSGAETRSAASSICPVCGMVVAPESPWTATVVHANEAVRRFDGPKDLFKYLLLPDRYPHPEGGGAVDTVTVTAYYDQAVIPARDALFVVGSDVMGPMGAELIPHRTRDEAEEFLADHRGERILTYGEVTPEVLEPLG